MKKFIYILIIFLIAIFASCQFSYAQSPSGIKSKCSGTLVYSEIQINRLGDIVHTPCSGRSSIFNGLVDFTNATITGVVSGSGTANFVPRFTAASVIGNTPLSWDNTNYVFNNTALNSTFTLAFTPNNTTGSFVAGDTATNSFRIIQAANTTLVSGRNSAIGDLNGQVTGLRLSIGGSANTATFSNTSTSNNINYDFSSTGIATFSVSDFQIKNSFAVASASDCTGTGTIGGGGTVTITISSCTAFDASSVILATYKDKGGANILPLSVTESGGDLLVRGDAAADIYYWIINRY